MEEALEVARDYRGEASTRLGMVSRALLELADAVAEPARAAGAEQRRHGLVVARPTWLSDTARVQREVFRLEPDSVGYLRDQVFACVVELAELIQEVPWKAARDGLVNQGESGSLSAALTERQFEAARKELVDAMHFLANAAVALGLDDDSLWDEYNRVSCANVDRRRRQEHQAGEG